ncbi:hypothetical protein [Veillonella sp. 3310]|uniref:hypothetical protein n=1 Tax=Veillonella sp. 3310 TaxID=2490956 RepID=UPI000FD65C18|nr:hypothetical protein [Veillonella sp. 3310]
MKNTTFEQLVNTLQQQTCKLKKIVVDDVSLDNKRLSIYGSSIYMYIAMITDIINVYVDELQKETAGCGDSVKMVDAATVTAVCLLLLNIKQKMDMDIKPFEELPLNLSEFKAVVEYMLDSIECCIGRKAVQEQNLKYSKPTVIH